MGDPPLPANPTDGAWLSGIDARGRGPHTATMISVRVTARPSIERAFEVADRKSDDVVKVFTTS